MADAPASEGADDDATEAPSEEGADDVPDAASTGAGEDADAPTTEELRERVEEEYDFEDFGPEDMARMSYEEWEAAFDHETWLTGEELLDRVAADLESRIADREVFARLERLDDPDRVVAYSDEGYAVVYPDGSVEGEGTVLRDVKPTVALCSMADYEVPEPPEGELLPDPMDVPEGSGELGNRMVQVVGAAQIIGGILLLGGWLFGGLNVVAMAAGFGFVAIGLLLFLVVANARLSDRFRAEEYRNRLRAVGVDAEDRPEFLPETARPEDDEG